MLWNKDLHLLTVEIIKLKCKFSQFLRVNADIAMKIHLAQNAPKEHNIFSIFHKEDDLKKNLVKEAQTSIKKRQKEILFNEKIQMIVSSDTLADYSIRLVICTVDKENIMENMGQAVIPLQDLEFSTTYSTNAVLQPVLKVRYVYTVPPRVIICSHDMPSHL